MVQKSKNLKKFQKISKFHFFSIFFFFEFFFFFAEKKKKCYPLSFPILGGRDSTRALQSSPFQKYENLKKSKKFTFFQNFFFLKFFLLSSQFSNIRRTRFDQSSPVQPVSESRGGSTSVTEKENEEEEGNPRV